MTELPSIGESPVPDRARLERCAAGVRASEAEVFGPPESILALGRWLREPVSETVDLAGSDRDGWATRPGSLRIELDDREALHVTVSGGSLLIAGAAAALDALGEVVQDVGVKALDWRWAPTERRATVTPIEGGVPPMSPESLALHVASAYPLEPL